MESKHRIHPGGLFRCCIESLRNLTEDERDSKTRKQCPHCNRWIKKDAQNLWSWDPQDPTELEIWPEPTRIEEETTTDLMLAEQLKQAAEGLRENADRLHDMARKLEDLYANGITQ